MIHETTCDPIARGRLIIRQPRQGYRFNVDSVILAGFSLPSGRRVCDLGTGSGVIGLWLATEGAEHVTGVELQPELAELARINASDNGLERVFCVVVEDLRAFSLGPTDSPYDQVVCNPPFGALGSGRVDADPQRAMARHEIAMCLPDIFHAARRLLRPGGRLCFIHRADREKEIIEASFASGMILTRMRRVLPRVGRPPSRLLVEAICETGRSAHQRPRGSSSAPPMRRGQSIHEGRRVASDAEMRIEPELIVHDDHGGYAPEVASLLGD